MNRNQKILIIVMTGLLTTSIIAFFLTSYLMVGCTEDTASSDDQGQGVQPLWIKQIGTPAGTSVYDMVMEKDDKILVTGTVSGRLPLSATYGNNFLMRFTTEGEHIWTRQYDFGMNGKVKKMELDSDGNIYLIGSTYGDIGELKNANQSSSPGSTDVFLTKINKSGDIIWTKMWGSEMDDEGNSLVISTDGFIHLVAISNGNFLEYTNLGEFDIFLMKLDFNGKLLLSKHIGNYDNDGIDFIYDKNKMLYLLGISKSNWDNQKNNGHYDLILLTLDQDYNIIWTKMWGTEEWDETTGMAFDNQGNFYLTWNINSKDGAFQLIKGDFNGKTIWKKELGKTKGGSISQELIIAKNRIYITGATSGQLEGQTLADGANSDFFLMEVDLNGSLQWVSQIGTVSNFNTGDLSGQDYGKYVCSDKNGFIYVAGGTNGYMEPGYDPGYIPSDMFIMKFNPNGVP